MWRGLINYVNRSVSNLCVRRQMCVCSWRITGCLIARASDLTRLANATSTQFGSHSLMVAVAAATAYIKPYTYIFFGQTKMLFVCVVVSMLMMVLRCCSRSMRRCPRKPVCITAAQYGAHCQRKTREPNLHRRALRKWTP